MFFPSLERTAITFSTNKFYKLCFRTINKAAVDSSVSAESVAVKDDMPIQIQNPYVKEKRQCVLCKFNIDPDYKNVRLLSQFQSRHTGKIYERHITGLCKHKQKRLQEEIFKAQSAGLMGYWTKEPEFVKDPQLFDPNHPFRPHKY